MTTLYETRIADIRHFNRLWTRQIGLLANGYLQGSWSLTEVRVLYELAHANPSLTLGDLVRDLQLDPGYLSRLVARLERKGHLIKSPSLTDGRQIDLGLTETGREVFAELEAQSREAIGELLETLPEPDQARLVSNLQKISAIFGQPTSAKPVLIRGHRPGDFGWIVERHGALYAQEYGWTQEFEGLVAGIVSDIIATFDPVREHVWIAEQNGERLGAIALVRATDEIAKLRLLFVEPSARSLGVGGALVTTCLQFARDTGYKRVTLWTVAGLDAARHLYERAGFTLTNQEPLHAYGQQLTSQTWDLDL